MKNYKYLLLAAAFFIAVSCKKSNAPVPLNYLLTSDTIKLSAVDSNKTISILNGHVVSITLNNPGDGGYTFDAPKCDTTVFRLINHIRVLPLLPYPVTVGDFGQDIFQFQALKSGTSNINITASRGPAHLETVTMFRNKVNVQ